MSYFPGEWVSGCLLEFRRITQLTTIRYRKELIAEVTITIRHQGSALTDKLNANSTVLSITGSYQYK